MRVALVGRSIAPASGWVAAGFLHLSGALAEGIGGALDFHLRSCLWGKELAMLSGLDCRYWMLTLVLLAGSAAQAAENRNFVAVLSGDGEVPERETRGRGVAKFQLSYDGSTLSYQLNVANIHNVVAAHIHVGAANVNGPIVAFLAGDFPP